MQKRIFISRDLKTSSPFLNDLPTTFEVLAFSLLELTAVPFASVPVVDWIFFYSQNAIDFFFNQVEPNTLKVKYAVFGHGTAQALRHKGITPDFIGTGKGVSTASAFEAIAKGQKVLFPRAKHSKKTIQRLLHRQIQIHDLVVYNNLPKNDFSIPEMDILVFTSPMNAKAYFGKYSLQKQQRVLAIGSTTAETLKQLGIDEVKVAHRPSEDSLVALFKDNDK